MEVDSSRVLEVLADLPDGAEMRGTGFLLRADLVLTAWHVVDGAARVTMVLEAGSERSRTLEMRSFVRLGSSDVALVAVDADWGVVTPVQVGRFGERAAVIDCEAFGFPWFKMRNADGTEPRDGDGKPKFRELTQIPLRLAPQGNWRTGRCEVTVAAPPSDPPFGGSPWEGMSGAPVFDRSGLLVAVVTDHHRREGLSRLAAARLDLGLDTLGENDRTEVLALLGWESLDQLPTAGAPPWAAGKLQALADRLTEIVPVDGLQDRDDELAELASFCAGDASYTYWQAPPWAGKTALMATLALHPPAGVTVVPYFVTARQAGENDSNGFLHAVAGHLAALAGEELPNMTTMADAYHSFLRKCVRQAHAVGQQLVLIVDGLDEDTGTEAGSGLRSIASLLPRHPPDGLKVIVAGRPDPQLPGDLPADHPLWHCQRRILEASPHAAEIGRVAQLELRELLVARGLRRDVVGLITASGGGLTLIDLEKLTGQPRYDIAELLKSVFGRTVRGRLTPAAGDPQHVYLFAHDVLREQAVDLIGDVELAGHRQRIHHWADQYHADHWPATTPQFLLTGYPRLLEAIGDTARLTSLAEDVARHDLMLACTGGDDTAYSEIHAALTQLAATANPDLRTIVRLARHRETLLQRHGALPAGLPALWAQLGQVTRAEAIIRSRPDPLSQAETLASVARTILATRPADAARLLHDAEQTARAIFEPDRQAQALTAIATIVVHGEPDRAEQILRTITTPGPLARALASAAQSIWETREGLAVRLIAEAERIAHSLTDPDEQARTLSHIAQVTAQFDVERAQQIVHAVRQPGEQTRALVAIVAAAVVLNTDGAVRVASGLLEPAARAEAMINAAEAIIHGDTARAARLAVDAEQIAGQTPYPHLRARALMVRIQAAAIVDLDRAEAMACAVTDSSVRVRALEAVALEIGGNDRHRTERIAARAFRATQEIEQYGPQQQALTTTAIMTAAIHPDRALRMADTIKGAPRRLAILTAITQSIAATDPDQAEQTALAITDASTRAQVLTSLAQTMVRSDPVRAARLAGIVEEIARTIADPSLPPRTRATVVQTIADRDPEQAIAVARTLTGSSEHVDALTSAATTIAATDIENALEMVKIIADPRLSARALAMVAKVVVDHDPPRAVAIAIEASELPSAASTEQRAQLLTDLVHTIGLVDPHRAEQLARTIADPGARSRALLDVAAALSSADPQHAVRLLEDAEQAVSLITELHTQAQTLTNLMPAIADRNPTRAEEHANAITEPATRLKALSLIARTVAPTDLARAVRILQSAEDIARTIPDSDAQIRALTESATAIATHDAARALQIVNAIADPRHLTHALATLAKTLAEVDPGHALQLVDDALRAARRIADDYQQSDAYGNIAQTIASSLPERAEQLARTLADPEGQARALLAVAQGLVTDDPKRAAQVGIEAAQVACSITRLFQRTMVLTGAVRIIAVGDRRAAEQIARTIDHASARSQSLAEVAKMTARADSDYAERVARTIPRREVEAQCLLELATVWSADPGSGARIASVIASAIVLGGSWIAALPAVDAATRRGICQDLLAHPEASTAAVTPENT
ncbi:hypothetical protein HDA40_001877 [Hamadaea flava]|uniref:Trypsin-like peptidase domain-containing protein n=1 Tax=Hamadaea flava TaxID=1742688 RepID=A0ABV8LDN6_9ACTN|nr:serine protease [Hamadaea flava]MCP2323370.1 hypothetical protein [Hamadaea flava]